MKSKFADSSSLADSSHSVLLNEKSATLKYNTTKTTSSVFLVYFSSISNNTHRFIQKIGVENARIPVDLEESLTVDRPYVLVCPTYSGGGNHTSGAVPKPVIKFLNNSHNRNFCKAIIASGNTNFGNTYGLAGSVLSQKLGVPLLYTFEISGTQSDIKKIQTVLEKFWSQS